MGQAISLKVRLDLLFGLLLFLGLAADIGRMVSDAGPRVRAEGEAMTRISRDFVIAALVNLNGVPDPEAKLPQLISSLGALRHIRISYAPSQGGIASAIVPVEPAREQGARVVLGSRSGPRPHDYRTRCLRCPKTWRNHYRQRSRR